MKMVYNVYILILLFLLKMRLSQTNVENFGPYKWDWLKYESCKGPKKGECGTVRVENIHNMSDVIYILDITQDCSVTKGKVIISKLHDNGTIANKLWNYNLNKPCEHFVLGPILVTGFNLNNRCKINKGHYEVHVNMYEMSRKFLGTKFFYGVYSFKIIAFNDRNNLFCQFAAITVTKSLINSNNFTVY